MTQEKSKTQQDKKLPKVSSEKESRVTIINTVQTPLGFFVLVVLLVEAIFGITANFSNGSDKTVIIIGMLALIFILVLIVASMALFRPKALYGISKETTASQKALTEIKIVKKPKILYTGSFPEKEPGQGMSQDAQQDIEILKNAFPKLVVVERNLNADKFREILTHNKFDIIQLNMNVTNDGSLEFWDKFDKELIPGEGLVKLLEISNTKLLVLACCDSVPLAAKLAMRVNMIAAAGYVEVKAFDKWERVFYHLLSEESSLSKAYAAATSSVQVGYVVNTAPLSVVMVMKQDVIFRK